MMENEYLLHTVADMMNAAPRTQEEENEYRRGYSDGFIAAVNLLSDVRPLGVCASGVAARRRIPAAYLATQGAMRLLRRADMDHVMPRSRGGRTTQSNLVPACARCNYDKGARTPEEWRGNEHVRHE